MIFDTLATALYENNYNIIAPDLRGFGLSSYNNPIKSFEDLASDVNLFVQELEISDKFNLLGLSMGGSVALTFAGKYPNQLKNLFTLGALGPQGWQIFKQDANGQLLDEVMEVKNIEDIEKIVHWREIQQQIQKNNDYSALISYFKTFFFKKEYAPQPEERFLMFIKEAAKQNNYLEMMFAMTQYNIAQPNTFNGYVNGNGLASKIECPTHILHGDSDARVPVEFARQNAQQIKNSQIHIVPDAGHKNYENLQKTLDIINKSNKK